MPGLEERLLALLPPADGLPQPLFRAVNAAVFAGGKRLRPRLLLAVAQAYSTDEAQAELSMLAACAIELVHCASLVHDDLPCFDDAVTRRGQPTVHVLYGEAIAVLVGDALLNRAYEVLAEAPPPLAFAALRIIRLLGRATGIEEGIIGGQGLEAQERSSALGIEHVARYHMMKTASLFKVAAQAGAIAAGAKNAVAWAQVGAMLGLAYQLADDLCDDKEDAEQAAKRLNTEKRQGPLNAAVQRDVKEREVELHKLLEQAREVTQTLAPQPSPVLGFIDRLSINIRTIISGRHADRPEPLRGASHLA